MQYDLRLENFYYSGSTLQENFGNNVHELKSMLML